MMEAILILSILLASIGAVLAFFAIWTVRRAPAAQTREEKLSNDLTALRKEFDFYRQEREREAAAFRAEIAGLQTTVETLGRQLAADAAVKARLGERIQMLEKTLARFGIRDDTSPLPPAAAMSTLLRKVLVNRLTDDELPLLVADVAGNPDAVSGATKELLAQNLISYCTARNMMDKLLLALHNLRPDVEVA